jgi:predicted ATPase
MRRLWVANAGAEGGQGGQARRGINDEQRHRASHTGGYHFLHETTHGRRQRLGTFYDGFELIGGSGFHTGT